MPCQFCASLSLSGPFLACASHKSAFLRLLCAQGACVSFTPPSFASLHLLLGGALRFCSILRLLHVHLSSNACASARVAHFRSSHYFCAIRRSMSTSNTPTHNHLLHLQPSPDKLLSLSFKCTSRSTHIHTHSGAVVVYSSELQARSFYTNFPSRFSSCAWELFDCRISFGEHRTTKTHIFPSLASSTMPN